MLAEAAVYAAELRAVETAFAGDPNAFAMPPPALDGRRAGSPAPAPTTGVSSEARWLAREIERLAREKEEEDELDSQYQNELEALETLGARGAVQKLHEGAKNTRRESFARAEARQATKHGYGQGKWGARRLTTPTGMG